MKKFLRTYRPFTENAIKSHLAYKARFYLFIICRLFGVFITYFLWKTIYQNSASGVMGGLTQNQMITYIFMSYIASSIINIGVCGDVGSNVVDGSIATYLIRPMDYRMSLIARALGSSIYHFFIPSILVWIGLEVYRSCALGLAFTSLPNILLFLLSCMLSFLLYVLFDFCFGMLSFVTTYIWGMLIIRNALMAFLTGQLIPLTFFPEWLQRVFDFLPFSSMNYVPVMIYLGTFSTAEILFCIGRQILWVIIMYLMGSYLWRKVTKRLVILGG